MLMSTYLKAEEENEEEKKRRGGECAGEGGQAIKTKKKMKVCRCMYVWVLKADPTEKASAYLSVIVFLYLCYSLLWIV